jgi:uncharacterized membrane protein
MTLAQIHARAFQGHVRWRNIREYVAALVVIPAFAWLAVAADHPVTRIGAGLVILGTLVAMWQLYRRGSAQAVPTATAASSLAFHRQQLVRQRDALRSVWLWYLAPFAPGMVTILAGRWLANPGNWGPVAISFATFVTVFGLVFALNRWGARRLQAQIEELDALGGGE